MSQFGPELRKAREERGIALASIAGVTKISERNLVALEREEFDRLPGGVLSKGFVRAYARAVGLDENDWLGRYMAAYRQSGQLKDDDQGWIEFAENVSRARKGEDPRAGQAMRWAGVALLLTLLALFSWYVARFVNDRAVSVTHHQPNQDAALTIPRKVITAARNGTASSTQVSSWNTPSGLAPAGNPYDGLINNDWYTSA